MKLLLLSQLRDLRSRWLVTSCVVAGVALAVTSVTVVHVVSEETVRTINSNIFSSNYQYVVPIDGHDETHYFTIRRMWRSGELPTISGMMPVIQGTIAARGSLTPILGTDFLADVGIETIRQDLVEDGSLLVTDVLHAFGTDLRVGDQVYGATVSSTIPSEGNLLIGDIATVQKLLGREGQIDFVWLRRTTSPTNSLIEQIWPGFLTGLGYRSPHLEIPDFRVQDMSDWSPTQTFAGSIAFNLSLLGALAILVAGFIAYEASSSSVNRRSLELSRLESLGVTAREIKTVFCIEALVVASVGAVVGVLIALVTVQLLDLHVSLENKNAFAVGSSKAVCVATLSFVMAVLVATKNRRPHVSRIASVALSMVAIAIAIIGFFPQTHLLGAFLVVVALCLIQISAIVPVSVLATTAVSRNVRLNKLMWVLVLRRALKQFQHFRVPVIAFSLAIGTAIGVSLMVSSFRTNFEELLDQRLPPGLIVYNASEVDEAVLRKWPGVEGVRTYYRQIGDLSKGPVELVATNIDSWESSRYGYGESVANGALINHQLHRKYNLDVGDLLTVWLADGVEVSFPIVHVFNSYGNTQVRAILPKTSTPPEGWLRDRILIEAPRDRFAEMVVWLGDLYPNVEVTDNESVRTEALKIFDRTFVLTNVIAFLASVVAVVGVFAASLALHGAQIQEYRLLRTVGVSEGSIMLSTLVQSSIFGILACVLSIPLGLAVAASLCSLVNPRAFDWTIDLSISASPLLIPLVFAFASCMLASFLPFFLKRRLV